MGIDALDARHSCPNLSALGSMEHHAPQLDPAQPMLLTDNTCQDNSTLYNANHAQDTSMAIGPLGPLSKLAVDYVIHRVAAIESVVDEYANDVWTRSGDERTSRLPLMSCGPWKLIYATCIYLCLIKWLLPRAMQARRAFELQWCIRVYNLLMVLSNSYAFYHGIRLLDFGRKCFGCEVINHKDYSAEAMELLHYGWLFLLSRLIEWLDTIFFVLRKKDKQVTKLHVFHHSFVPLLCWVYLKFHPGYTVAFFPFVNTLVHTIMYSYYFLATFGPAVQPYLWWKRYLTSLQIAQFVLILIQLATIPLSTSDKCKYPRGFLAVAFAGAILFLWLFYTYYLDTYTTSKKSARIHASAEISRHEAKFDSPRRHTCLQDCRNAIKEGESRSLVDVIENAIGDAAISCKSKLQ